MLGHPSSVSYPKRARSAGVPATSRSMTCVCIKRTKCPPFPLSRTLVLKPVSIARPILVFGLVGGALTLLLRTVEYRYLVLEHSTQMYGGLIAVIFVGFGIWLGLTLTRKPETIVVKEFSAAAPATFARNSDAVSQSGLTPRELEILEHIARGLSNKEIAEQVNLSENTVKTHSKRVFEKLNAKRRTQAVRAGKALGILP